MLAVFPEVMRMLVHAGIKIRSCRIDRNLIHQSRIAKGAQRIVNCCKRNGFTAFFYRQKQAFGGYMPIMPVTHKQPCKRQSLTCRPDARAGKPVCARIQGVIVQLCKIGIHETYIGLVAHEFQTKFIPDTCNLS